MSAILQQPKLFRGRLNRRSRALNPVVTHFLPSCEIILFHLSDFRLEFGLAMGRLAPEFGLAIGRPPFMYAEGNAEGEDDYQKHESADAEPRLVHGIPPRPWEPRHPVFRLGSEKIQARVTRREA